MVHKEHISTNRYNIV